MTSFFDNGPLPDFKEIRKWLGTELPWKLAEQWDKANDSKWLDTYVKGIIEKSKQPSRELKNGLLKIDTLREEKHVTVSIAIPDRIKPEELRLFATADRLKIAGLPNDRKQTVRFPCLVLPRSGRISASDGLMTVRFRRRPPARDEVELFIRP